MLFLESDSIEVAEECVLEIVIGLMRSASNARQRKTREADALHVVGYFVRGFVGGVVGDVVGCFVSCRETVA
jgi:hypothetical protein